MFYNALLSMETNLGCLLCCCRALSKSDNALSEDKESDSLTGQGSNDSTPVIIPSRRSKSVDRATHKRQRKYEHNLTNSVESLALEPLANSVDSYYLNRLHLTNFSLNITTDEGTNQAASLSLTSYNTTELAEEEMAALRRCESDRRVVTSR